MRLRQYFRELSRRIRKWLNKSRFVLGLTLLAIGISWTHLYHELTQKSHTTILFEARNALAEETVKDTTEVVELATSPILSLEDKIRQTFPECPEKAIAIAQCESTLDISRIGDGHLAFEYKGEILGESIGLFQIRTGGNENGKAWSRPEKLGLTVKEFKEKMLNPDENIKYARDIYDRSGGNFSKWTCDSLI